MLALPTVLALVTALPALPPAPASPDDPGPRASVPPEGVGLLVGGAITGALGAGMLIAGFGESCTTCDHDFNRRMGYVGIGTVAVAAGLVAGGSVLRRRFVEWRTANRLRVPKRGNGMFVGGGALVAFGVVAFAVTPNAPRAAIPGALWTLGGAGLIAGGAVLRTRFGRWKHVATAGVRVAPAIGSGGAGLTVIGRF